MEAATMVTDTSVFGIIVGWLRLFVDICTRNTGALSGHWFPFSSIDSVWVLFLQFPSTG